MKTYNIIPVVLLSLALAACKKQAGVENTAPFYSLPSDGMLFKASNAGGAVKSHFQNISQSGQLVWDATDVLAVYSVDPAAEDITTSAVQGLAYIDPAFEGEVNAEFLSVNTEAQWYDGSSSRWFFATYPCYDAASQQHLQKFESQASGEGGEGGEGEAWKEYVLPVYVESNQEYASGFQTYQILYSNGGSFSPGETVSFGAFTPMTSLIRFRLKSKGSACNVREIRFSYGYENIYYYGDHYLQSEPVCSLAGVQLWKVDPATRTLSPLEGYEKNWWNSSVTMDFMSGGPDPEGGVAINSSYSDYFYLVVLPTISIPVGKEMLIQIEADYYELWDNHYKGNAYQLKIPVPEVLQNGFEMGKCYSFGITLDEGYLSVGFEGSCNIGEYEINTQWGEED